MFCRVGIRPWLPSLSTLSFLLFFQANMSISEANTHHIRDRRHRDGFHSVDSIFVIHLESREDRLHQINDVLSSLRIPKYDIIKGIPHRCGAMGCSLSHAMAMSECMKSNATTCAVFEDDFELSGGPEDANAVLDNFFRTQPPSWDVLMLSANVVSSSPSSEFSHLEILNWALTTSGYIVQRGFASTLLQIFMQAAYHLNESNCSKEEFAHDVLWKELQQSGKWFAVKPLIGKQRASYSDIEKRVVDYKVKLRRLDSTLS